MEPVGQRGLPSIEEQPISREELEEVLRQNALLKDLVKSLMEQNEKQNARIVQCTTFIRNHTLSNASVDRELEQQRQSYSMWKKITIAIGVVALCIIGLCFLL